jgi:hypothetical protein
MGGHRTGNRQRGDGKHGGKSISHRSVLLKVRPGRCGSHVPAGVRLQSLKPAQHEDALTPPIVPFSLRHFEGAAEGRATRAEQVAAFQAH